MKIDLKKILKSSLLVLMILLNCGWTPVSVVGSGTGITTTGKHSSCDEDIKNLGINPEEYVEYDYSLVLLAEVSNQYLICYMYDKYENFNYKQIDFEYATASSETSLSLVKTKQIRRDVEILSTSTDGLIKKILVKDFEIQNGKYRKYVVNQLTSADYEQNSDNDKRYLSLAIGTEYIYTTNSDGALSYHVNAINYVTIENQVVYHYNIRTDNTHLGKWRWAPKNGSVGNRYGMLGFSAKQLDIEKLQEVEVIYDVYDYSCYVPRDDCSLPNIYNEENIKKLKENNPKYTNATDLSYLSEYGEVKNLVEKDRVEVIISETISEDKFNGEDWFGKKVKNKFWDSIFEYNDIDKYFSEKDDERTNADMKEKFKDCEYIITIFKSADNQSYDNNSHGYKFTQHSYREVIGQKLDNDFYRFLARCDTRSLAIDSQDFGYTEYAYYQFKSQEASNACVVRLKYLDEFNTPHDVKVISAPVDSSGNIAGGDQTDPDKNWWEEFLEMLMMIIIIVIIVIVLIVFAPIIIPFIPVIFSVIINGIKYFISWIVKGISIVFSYIKIGVYKIGEFISSIFHR